MFSSKTAPETSDEDEKVTILMKREEWKNSLVHGHMSKLVQVGLIDTWRKKFFVLKNDGRLFHFRFDKNEPKNAKVVHVKGMKFWNSKKKKIPGLRIEKYPKPLIFHGEPKQVLEWREKLIDVGCLFCEYEIPEISLRHQTPEISKKELHKWTFGNVQQWLNFVSSTTEDKSVVQVLKNLFQKKEVNGKYLEKMNKEMLVRKIQEMDLPAPPNHSEIMNKILEIQKFQRFRYGEHIVRKKLRKMTSYFHPDKTHHELISDPDYFIRALSDPSLMCEAYLNQSTTHNQFYKYINPLLKDDEEDSQRGYRIVYDMEKDFIDIKKKPKKELKLGVRIWTNEMREEKGAPIERILSPVFKKLPTMSKDFGNFKISIIIGNFLLDWTEQSLCIPKRWDNDTYFILRDIDWNISIRNTSYEDIIKSIAETVCRWNITKKTPDFMKCLKNKSRGIFFYDRLTNPNRKFSDFCGKYQRFVVFVHWVFENLEISKDVLEHQILPFISEKSIHEDPNWKIQGELETGSCVDFFDDLMSSLRLSFKKEGITEEYLRTMKKQGLAEMIFKPDKSFREKFELANEEKIPYFLFETHAELDEFVMGLSRVDEIALRFDYREEEKLLQSFDRAFWYRHFKKPSEEKYKPSKSKCPFDDPRKTRGYYIQYN